VRAVAQVPPDLQTNVIRQLIVDKIRQFTKNTEAPSGFMPMGCGCKTSSWFRGGTFYHRGFSLRYVSDS
jgi:hypothetical protein